MGRSRPEFEKIFIFSLGIWEGRERAFFMDRQQKAAHENYMPTRTKLYYERLNVSYGTQSNRLQHTKNESTPKLWRVGTRFRKVCERAKKLWWV